MFESEDAPMFARSMFGKCDAEIKVRITSESKFRLATVAHSLGMTESEFVRELIDARIWGADHMQKVAQARVLAVAGTLATQGDERGTFGGQL